MLIPCASREIMLQQLGINATVFIQFGLFVFAITFLTLYVFGPFAKAVEEREMQTKGSQDQAVELEKQTVELHSEYEKKAREVHGKIQEVYKLMRADASHEYEKTVQAARKDSDVYVEQIREQIKKSVDTARDVLKKDTPQIVMALTQKLLGK
jgi:F-type H+-transporting ATPase subunit b